MLKKILYTLLAGILIWYVVIVAIAYRYPYLVNTDSENVELTCYVYDKESEMPVTNARLRIENWAYDGGDYDSYSTHALHTGITDKEGCFVLHLKKSAFIAIECEANGYKPTMKSLYPNEKEAVRVDLSR
jgi:hypothetical protein